MVYHLKLLTEQKTLNRGVRYAVRLQVSPRPMDVIIQWSTSAVHQLNNIPHMHVLPPPTDDGDL